MGLFNKSFRTQGIEEVLEEWAATREQNAGRAVMGRLVLTDRRLVFTPNRLDSAFRGETVAIMLGEVTAVAEEKVASTNSGHLELELRVTVTDGKIERLSVADVPRVCAEVQRAVSALHQG